MRTQVGDLLLAAETLLADQGDHLDLGRHDVENHVETHLVVTGPRTAVAEIVGADAPCIRGNGRGLRNAFGADRNGIGPVFEHIAENHVLDGMVVVVLRHIERHVTLDAQPLGPSLDPLQLLGRKTARIRQRSMDFEAHLLGQIDSAVRRIEASAKGQNHFFHRISVLKR